MHVRGREHPVAIVERATDRKVVGLVGSGRRGGSGRGGCWRIEVQRQGVGVGATVRQVASDPLDLVGLELERRAVPHREQLLAVDEAVHLVDAHVELPRGVLIGGAPGPTLQSCQMSKLSGAMINCWLPQ